MKTLSRFFVPHRLLKFGYMALTAVALSVATAVCLSLPAAAMQTGTPWTPEKSYQNLTYGASSYNDVISIVGHPPDEIVNSGQMYPLVENFYYFDENKTGAATVFVFENGLLVGLQYKSPDNQYVDLSYVLQYNGDRTVNYAALGGYQAYFPYFPLYGSSW
jgi:hypothetical protein